MPRPSGTPTPSVAVQAGRFGAMQTVRALPLVELRELIAGAASWSSPRGTIHDFANAPLQRAVEFRLPDGTSAVIALMSHSSSFSHGVAFHWPAYLAVVQMAPSERLEALIRHEVTHLFLDCLGHRSHPSFFSEACDHQPVFSEEKVCDLFQAWGHVISAVAAGAVQLLTEEVSYV